MPQLAPAPQRQHPQLYARLPAASAGDRDLELQLHWAGLELNRLPLTGRLRQAQLTAHRNNCVRQARQLAISIRHANTPLHHRS